MPELITHRIGLDEIQEGYDISSRPEATGALKVAMFGPESAHKLRAGHNG